MADDLPTPAKGVYLFFEFIALGFALGAVEEFLRGSSWHSWVLALALAAAFLFLGVAGPKLKNSVAQLVGRLRTSRALRAALADNADLKRQLVALRNEHRTSTERLANEYDTRFRQAGGQILTLQRELEALRNRPVRKLTIHSARWVIRGEEHHNPKNAAPGLLRHVNESLVEGLSILLTNDNLGVDDPKPDTHKLLKFTYSYGENGVPQNLIKHEGERLTLPELPDSRIPELERRATETHLMLSERDRQESVFLKSKVSDLEHQIVELKRLPSPRLTVQSAHYGKPPNLLEDVTMPLQALIQDNKLNIVVSWNLFELGFSSAASMAQVMSPGPMFLKIVYSLGDLKDLVIVRPEGARLELPE